MCRGVLEFILIIRMGLWEVGKVGKKEGCSRQLGIGLEFGINEKGWFRLIFKSSHTKPDYSCLFIAMGCTTCISKTLFCLLCV